MILSMLKDFVKNALHEATAEWLLEVGVSRATVEEVRRQRLATAAAAEASADAHAAAALGVLEEEVGSPAALPMPAAARTTEPVQGACPPPGDEAALMQWVGRRREEGVTWVAIGKTAADAGHDLGAAALRRRFHQLRQEDGLRS